MEQGFMAAKEKPDARRNLVDFHGGRKYISRVSLRLNSHEPLRSSHTRQIQPKDHHRFIGLSVQQ